MPQLLLPCGFSFCHLHSQSCFINDGYSSFCKDVVFAISLPNATISNINHVQTHKSKTKHHYQWLQIWVKETFKKLEIKSPCELFMTCYNSDGTFCTHSAQWRWQTRVNSNHQKINSKTCLPTQYTCKKYLLGNFYWWIGMLA